MTAVSLTPDRKRARIVRRYDPVIRATTWTIIGADGRTVLASADTARQILAFALTIEKAGTPVSRVGIAQVGVVATTPMRSDEAGGRGKEVVATTSSRRRNRAP